MCCSGRVYDQSHGNHHPVCGGACLLPFTGWNNLLPVTFLMLVVPVGVWMATAANTASQHFTIAAPISVLALMLTALTFMMLTYVTEPGILPVVVYEHENSRQVMDSRSSTTEEESEVGRSREEERASAFLRNGGEQLRYGRLFVKLNSSHFELRQFRAKFCRISDNCVENFDHWCFWLGNAIAKRNYRYFWWFVVSSLLLSTLLLCLSIGIIIETMINDKVSFNHAISKSVSSVILGIYALLMFMSLFGLCGFHSFALTRNITTNEYIKNVYTVINPNPYDKGCLRNIWSTLYASVPRSRVAVCTQHTPLLPEGSSSSSSSSSFLPIPLTQDELALQVQGDVAVGGTTRGPGGGFHVINMGNAQNTNGGGGGDSQRTNRRHAASVEPLSSETDAQGEEEQQEQEGQGASAGNDTVESEQERSLNVDILSL